MDSREITKIVRNMNLYKNSINKKQLELNDTEYEMLRYITKRDSRSLIEVSSYLNVDKALVTRMSKKLERLGYVTITTNDIDSRKKLLKCTEKALEIKNEVVNEEVFFYEKCLEVLSKEEKENFLTLLEKVYLVSKKFRKEGWNFDKE